MKRFGSEALLGPRKMYIPIKHLCTKLSFYRHTILLEPWIKTQIMDICLLCKWMGLGLSCFLSNKHDINQMNEGKNANSFIPGPQQPCEKAINFAYKLHKICCHKYLTMTTGP